MLDSLKYGLNNILGNNQAGTWNVLPAVLTAWSNLTATQGSQTQYELYRQQGRNYIQNAKDNAELIQSRGEIALRNLAIKNKKERGKDVTTIAAKGGKLSGSNLDVLVEKEKMRRMDEQTIRANYANQAMIELVNGYQQAASTYGTLAAKANADKHSAFASILKGLEVYTTLQVRDAKTVSQANANQSIQKFNTQYMSDWLESNIGKFTPDTTTKVEVGVNEVKETPDSLSLNNIIFDSNAYSSDIRIS